MSQVRYSLSKSSSLNGVDTSVTASRIEGGCELRAPKDEVKDEVDRLTTSPVAIVPSAAALRRMGRKTPSQKRGIAKGDGIVYNVVGSPLKMPRYKVDNKTYTFVQTVELSTLASSTLVTTFSSVNFQEGQLGQHSQLESIFDQYRIIKIEWWSECVTPIGSSADNAGLFAVVIDYDDSTNLSNFSDALAYANCVNVTGFDDIYRVFKPHAAIAAYSGAFSSFSNVESPWVDCASNAVQHYGIKTAWTTTSSVIQKATFARFTIEYRNVR